MRWSLLILLVGCDPKPAADPQPTDGGAEASVCDDVPVVTWETHGRELLIENCQPCHGSAVVERYEAPAEVVFDTEADALGNADAILRVIDAAGPTMPPSRALNDLDRQLLEIWLTCWP